MEEDAARGEPESRRWYALAAAAVALILAIFVVLMATVGPAGSGGEMTPSPTAQPTGDGTSAEPTSTAEPSAGTPSASPASSSAGPVVLELGDSRVTVLPGWRLYADEVVQDDRRLVRLRHLETDTRIQIVTLTSINEDLATACSDLVTEQSKTYDNVAESATVDVSVAPGAEGVACSFTGTRTSDSVATKVDFTLVRRDTDSTTIVFRDTIPVAVPADSPARTELAVIECGAAYSFGVTISQCATPDQADG